MACHVQVQILHCHNTETDCHKGRRACAAMYWLSLSHFVTWLPLKPHEDIAAYSRTANSIPCKTIRQQRTFITDSNPALASACLSQYYLILLLQQPVLCWPSVGPGTANQQSNRIDVSPSPNTAQTSTPSQARKDANKQIADTKNKSGKQTYQGKVDLSFGATGKPHQQQLSLHCQALQIAAKVRCAYQV